MSASHNLRPTYLVALAPPHALKVFCAAWHHSMAEIEHFVNPNDKAHPRFKLVSA